MSRARDLANGITTLAPKASPTFTGTVTGITKAHVGLGNVDNVADANQTSVGVVTSGTFNNVIGTSCVIPASVGASLVLLKTSTPTGGDTGTDLDSFYNSSYDNYLLLGSGVRHSVDGSNVTFQWIKNDGSLESGSFYNSQGPGRRADGNPQNISVANADAGYLVPSMGSASREGASFAFTIANMTSGSLNTRLQGTCSYHHYSVGHIQISLGVVFDYGLDLRGMKIFAAGSGNSFQSTTKFSIYGYKNS